MNLPNYFLADLPPEATLSANMIAEACQALKRNRERFLAGRSTQSLLTTLSNVAASWLQADYPFRQLALDQGPRATGFSRPALQRGLDAFFKQLTGDQFRALLEQDLGHAQRLEGLVSHEVERKGNRGAMAIAPEMLVHIAAGNVPNPTLMSIVLGVLVGSAQFVKCATGASWLPRLFAHSLYELEPKLGACLEIAEWRGGSAELDAALFADANCVTATGSDQALAEIQARLPRQTRFLGYGHRVSFGYVAAEALTGWSARQVAAQAAADVAAWDQLGCLSPHVIYVQEGGGVPAEKFGELLAEALAEREAAEPRGDLPLEAAAAIGSRRSIYELRAAHSPETRLWASPGSTVWTVVYEADPRFQLSCLYRFVYVKSAKDLAEALQGADNLRGKVSTVGIAAPDHQAQGLATELARWGASRVCPLGQMQNPPLTWRHDGHPSLGDLITWTDWEH